MGKVFNGCCFLLLFPAAKRLEKLLATATLQACNFKCVPRDNIKHYANTQRAHVRSFISSSKQKRSVINFPFYADAVDPYGA